MTDYSAEEQVRAMKRRAFEAGFDAGVRVQRERDEMSLRVWVNGRATDMATWAHPSFNTPTGEEYLAAQARWEKKNP